MCELPGCLLIVTAEVDPAVEAEWNRCYDRVHLPSCARLRQLLRLLAVPASAIPQEVNRTPQPVLHGGLANRAE